MNSEFFRKYIDILEQQSQEDNVKIYLSKDPTYMGAVFVDKYDGRELSSTTIPADTLVGFEPDSKMKDPKSAANVAKIVQGIKTGDKLPPLLVRKLGSGYQVIDGHHRFWAHKQVGNKDIPVKIVPAEYIRDVKSKTEIPQDVLAQQ
jgi:hypothetical protein